MKFILYTPKCDSIQRSVFLIAFGKKSLEEILFKTQCRALEIAAAMIYPHTAKIRVKRGIAKRKLKMKE